MIMSAFGSLSSTINTVLDEMAKRAYRCLRPLDITPEEVVAITVRPEHIDTLRVARKLADRRIVPTTREVFFARLPVEWEGSRVLLPLRFSVDGQVPNLPLQPNYAYDQNNIPVVGGNAPIEVVNKVSERMSLALTMAGRVAVTKQVFNTLNDMPGLSAQNIRYLLPGIASLVRQAAVLAEQALKDVPGGRRYTKLHKNREQACRLGHRLSTLLVSTRAEHFKPVDQKLSPAIKLANETIAQMNVLGEQERDLHVLPVQVHVVGDFRLPVAEWSEYAPNHTLPILGLA